MQKEQADQADQIQFDTKITKLKKKYYFHELIQQSKNSNHYIVEDLDVEIADNQEQQETIFFYLKQSFFDNAKELEHAKQYYLKLINYCGSPFAKQDIICYTQVWDFHGPNGYFELVVVCNFGESDRVDVEQIDKTHINQFMHKLSALLSDMRKFGGLYHGNIFLKNIVLESVDPKLSGFKPIFLSNQSDINWINEFVRRYDHFKLDMFLLGLLWLKFLNTNIEDYFDQNLTLDQLLNKVENIKKSLTKEQLDDTVANFLNLNTYDQIDIDQIILQFNESLIMQMNEDSDKKDSQIKNSNLFNQSYKEEAYTLKNQSLNERNSDKNNLVKIRGENFTLQDEQSMDNLEGFDEMRSQVKKMESQKPFRENTYDVTRLSVDSKKARDRDMIKNKIKQYYQEEIQEQHESLEETTKQIKHSNEDEEQENEEDNQDEEEEQEYLSSKFAQQNDDDEEEREGQMNANEKEYQESQVVSTEEKSISFQKQLGDREGEVDDDLEDFQNLEKMAQQELLSKRESDKHVQEYVKITQERVKIYKKELGTKQEPLQTSESKKDYKLIFKKKSTANMDLNKLNQQNEEDDDEPEYVFGHKVEKPVQEDPELNKMIQQEMERKKMELEKKQREQKVSILKKHEEQKKKEKEMQDKIKRIAEQKLKKKKQKKPESADKSSSKNVSPPKEEKKPEKHLGISPSRITKEQKPVQPKPIQKTPNKKKEAKTPLDISQDNMKKNEATNYQDRQKMFEYNTTDYKNKQIPFKRIYDKYKAKYHPETFGEVSNYREVYKSKEVKQKELESTDLVPGLENQNYVQIKSVKNKSLQDNFRSEEENSQNQFLQEDSMNQEDIQEGEDSMNRGDSFENEYYQQDMNVNSDRFIQERNLDSEEMKIAFQGSNIVQHNINTEKQKTENNQQKPTRESSPPKNQTNDYESFGIDPRKVQKDGGQVQQEHPFKNVKKYESKTNKPKFNTQKEVPKQAQVQHTGKKAPTSVKINNPAQKRPIVQARIVENEVDDYHEHHDYQTQLSSEKEYGRNWREDQDRKESESLKENSQMFDIANWETTFQFLNNLKYQTYGLEKVEVLKGLSILFFRQKDFEKSILYLREAIDLLSQGQYGDQNHNIHKLRFSLALNYIEANQMSHAEKQLSLINPEKFLPLKYFMVKGDVHKNLGQNEEAFQCYIQELNEEIQKDLTVQSNSESILNLLVQIVNLILSFEKTEIVKFFNYILGLLSQLSQNGNKFQLEQIKVEFIMVIMNALLKDSSYDLLNYFLNQIAEQDLILIDYLSDNQFYILAKIYYQFSLYLKSVPNYGNQKESFLNFLNHSLFLLKQMKQTNFQVQNKIVEIALYKGVFFMQQKAYQQAKNNLKEAYDLCVTYLSSKAVSLLQFTVLYNLGVSFYQLRNYEDSLYYLEQIIESGCEFKNITEKTIKVLLKIYFKLDSNERCVEVLERHYEKLFNPMSSENFFYITLFYLCADNSGMDIGDLEAKIVDVIMNNEEVQNVHYLGVFQKLQLKKFQRMDFEDQEKLLGIINKILCLEENENQAEIFITEVNSLYAKFMLNKNLEAFDLVKSILKKMHKGQTIEENAKEIENFLYNFLLLILSKVPIDEKRANYRNSMIDKIRLFKENNQIYDKIYDLITSDSFMQSSKFFSEKSLQSGKFDQQDLVNYQKSFHDRFIKENKIVQNNSEVMEKAKKRFVKKKRVKSQEIIKNSNFHKKPHCLCYKYNFQNKYLCQKVDDFIHLVSSKEFQAEQILLLFEGLERELKDLKLTWSKFSYIKELMRHFSWSTVNQFDEKKNYQVVQKVLETDQICVHDIDNMVSLLECFSQPYMLEAFILYLNDKSPNLSKLVFRQVFYDTFYKILTVQISSLYEDLQKKKHYKVDNYPFMHYLGDTALLNIPKNLKLSQKIRKRDQFLNNPQFSEIFSKYIEESLMVDFLLDFNILKTIDELLKKQRNPSEVMTEFMNKMVEVVMEKNLDLISCEFFIFKFLIAVYCIPMDEENSPQIAEQIIQILFFIETRISQENFYYFAVTCSLIGNLLNKQELWEQSNKCKSMAFESLKKLQDLKPKFPRWFHEMKPKDLMKGILGFMMQNYLMLRKLEFAEKFLEKLLHTQPETPSQQMEIYITGLVFQLESGDMREIDQNLEFCEDKLMIMKISPFDSKIYEATIQYLKAFKMKIMQENEAVIQVQEGVSRIAAENLMSHFKDY